jgi:hypothetical protein
VSTDLPEGEAGARRARPARIVRPVRRRLDSPAAAEPGAPAGAAGPAAPSLDPADLAGALLADLAEVSRQEDPFEFEMLVSSFCGILDVAQAAAFTGALPPDVVPILIGQFAKRADALSLAALASLALLAEGEAGAAAARAAARMWRAGIVPPDWFEELDRALVPEECLVARRALDATAVVLCSFRRAGRRHAFAVVVRDEEGGAAEAIAPLPEEVLPLRLADLVAQLVPEDELESVSLEQLEPAEARRLLETAVARRALTDARLDLGARFDQWDEEAVTANVLGAPPYPTMIAALRSRIEALPEPDRDDPVRPAVEEDGGEYDWPCYDAPGLVFPDFPAAHGVSVFAEQDAGAGADGPALPTGMPRRRGPLDGPAPVYRLRIDLKGAKPPIWRRVELRGDTTLTELHEIIQTVFEWEGAHLHVFETGFGEFGDGAVDLGHGLEGEVTVEQVLSGPGARIVYVYDYGDYWQHVVRVERTEPSRPGFHAPRCIGGRRGAPPEDCGGIAEYQQSRAADPAASADADVPDLMELDRRLLEGGPWDGGGRPWHGGGPWPQGGGPS